MSTGGLTSRITARVLASIDLDALERRMVASDAAHEEKLQRTVSAVEASLRAAEVANAASIVRLCTYSWTDLSTHAAG